MKCKNLCLLAVLGVLAFLIYANVLHGQFISDDYIYIADNPAVKNIQNIPYLWESFNTRFLIGFSFALNYLLGGFNTFGYHLVNILIHIVNAFLVYHLALNILEKDSASKEKEYIAWLSALIFLCHPVQTQGVAFITQRAVSMATFFYLFTLVTFIKSYTSSGKGWFAVSLMSMFLAMFCKEMTITIPIMLFIYCMYFIRPEKGQWSACIKKIVPFCIVIVVLLGVFFIEKKSSILGLKYQLVTQKFSWQYFLTEINVLRTYLRMLILPVNLNHDYDYRIVSSLFELRTVFSAMLLLILLISAGYFYHKKKVLSFCIIWFFVTTSVEVVVVSFVNRGVIYDHWLYLPMAGFALFFSYIFQIIFKDKKKFIIVGMGMVVCFSLLSFNRNKAWQTEIGFWQDVISKSPHKADPYLGLGKAYDRIGDTGRALSSYYKALSLRPNFPRVLNNVGIIYFDQGKDKTALKYFLRAIEINPYFAHAYNNAGLVFFYNNRFERAVFYYEKSLQYQPPYPDGHFYLGQAYIKTGDLVKAKDHLKQAQNLYIKQDNVPMAQEAAQFLEELKAQER